MRQPARSPDVNVLDLALNHLLASVMQKIEMRAKEEIAAKLRETWVNYPPEKITKALAVLQTVFKQIIEHKGYNDFDICHKGLGAAEQEMARRTV